MKKYLHPGWRRGFWRLANKNRNGRTGRSASRGDYRNHYDHDHESRANTNNWSPNPSIPP
jgi:hypothetical protein